MKKSILALSVLSMLMTACGGGSKGGTEPEPTGTAPAKQTVLKIRFHVDEKSTEGIAYKKLVTAFNTEFSSEGLKVNATYVARTAGDSAYERALAKDRLDGTLPDIITFDAPNCAAYAQTGYLYDISSYYSTDEREQFITMNYYNNKLYGVPIQESSAGFYYNKSLFAQAGIDVSGISVDNPWTFDQFKAACQKLKDINVVPVDMRMDATQDETATYLLYPFIYAAGGEFVNPSNGKQAKGYFNSDASKKGFQFLKDLLSSGYTNYGIGATDFFTGKTGMYLSSGWTIPDLDNKFPTTFPNRDAWGLLPYPKDVKAASANGSWSFAVGNNSRKDKTPVIKLLKYLTNADSSKAITDATKMIPANKGVEKGYDPSSPEGVLYQQLQKTGMARPVTVGYPNFSKYFSQVISVLGQHDVSSLVDQRADALQDELDRIRI